MKTNKKRRIKLIYILLPVALILMALGALAYLYLRPAATNTPTSGTGDVVTETVNYSPATTEQKQSIEIKKTSDQMPASTSFTASITAVSDVGGVVQIRNVINGFIGNDGTCELTMASGNTVTSKSASTYALPSSSTCQGFDINRSELPAGNWQITLTVTINGERSVANSKIILE